MKKALVVVSLLAVGSIGVACGSTPDCNSLCDRGASCDGSTSADVTSCKDDCVDINACIAVTKCSQQAEAVFSCQDKYFVCTDPSTDPCAAEERAAQACVTADLTVNPAHATSCAGVISMP